MKDWYEDNQPTTWYPDEPITEESLLEWSLLDLNQKIMPHYRPSRFDRHGITLFQDNTSVINLVRFFNRSRSTAICIVDVSGNFLGIVSRRTIIRQAQAHLLNGDAHAHFDTKWCAADVLTKKNTLNFANTQEYLGVAIKHMVGGFCENGNHHVPIICTQTNEPWDIVSRTDICYILAHLEESSEFFQHTISDVLASDMDRTIHPTSGVTILSSQTAKDALIQMCDKSVGSLLVVDLNGDVVGVLNEKLIVSCLLQNGAFNLQSRVSDFMKAVHTSKKCNDSLDLRSVLLKMIETEHPRQAQSTYLVVETKSGPTILSMTDLVYFFAHLHQERISRFSEGNYGPNPQK